MKLLDSLASRWRTPLGALLAFTVGWVSTQRGPAEGPGSAAPTTDFRRWEPRVHDPSTLVPCGNEFWCFTTGPGIKSLRSRDLVHWEPGPPVFTNFPAWTRAVVPDHRGFFWAPDVLRVRDRYLLFYSVSSWGKNTSAIGLATNPTLNPADPSYRWTDAGIVIRSTSADTFNAIDPAATLDAEGRLWLAFGSFWSGIKLVELNPSTGSYLSNGAPIYALAHHESIEAAFLQRHGGHYFLFVNWGLCCRGTNSTYEIRVGRSAGITGPYLDRDGKNLLDGGGTWLLGTTGSFIGPGHAGILPTGGTNWLSCHFYDGTQQGRATLALLPLTWDAAGWPGVDAGKRLNTVVSRDAGSRGDLR